MDQNAKKYVKGLAEGQSQIDPYNQGVREGKKAAVGALREATFGVGVRMTASEKLARIRELAAEFGDEPISYQA